MVVDFMLAGFSYLNVLMVFLFCKSTNDWRLRQKISYLFLVAGFKKYLIKKGEHSSGFRIAPFYGNKIVKYEAIFTRSCLYEIDGPDRFDINKLFGISYGLHHKNSARFGWRANGDSIEISAYCYKSGDRIIKTIRDVAVGKPYVFTMRGTKEFYELTVESEGAIIGYAKISKPKTIQFGYRLFPYFGGNVPAPHNIRILIKRLV